MQEKIYEILIENDDITWKTMLYDLVKAEEMDPWDIDLVTLTQNFIKMVRQMQETDLKISGKVFLAAAILLKIKSSHLINHDISQLDQLLNNIEEDEGDEWDNDEFVDEEIRSARKQKYRLIPRNPQPRSRKVSIHDLVDALQKAMESKRRVIQKQKPIKFVMPERKVDIVEIIREVYNKINYYSKKDKTKELTFTRLLPPRAGKLDKVYTFIPMLHLENEKKISTRQTGAFDEIHIKLLKQKQSTKTQSKAQ